MNEPGPKRIDLNNNNQIESNRTVVKIIDQPPTTMMDLDEDDEDATSQDNASNVSSQQSRRGKRRSSKSGDLGTIRAAPTLATGRKSKDIEVNIVFDCLDFPLLSSFILRHIYFDSV